MSHRSHAHLAAADLLGVPYTGGYLTITPTVICDGELSPFVETASVVASMALTLTDSMAKEIPKVLIDGAVFLTLVESELTIFTKASYVITPG